ncbi:hypothetical protein PrNR1418_13640 [Providencia rettgeri]|nr:hypothetical protein BML2496_27080 [Providencia rettgeri]BDH18073.1 hypothetical protein PrNR1418_13640 [Providencia rettgeri]
MAIPSKLKGAIVKCIPNRSYHWKLSTATIDIIIFRESRNVIFDSTEPCQSNNRKNQC